VAQGPQAATFAELFAEVLHPAAPSTDVVESGPDLHADLTVSFSLVMIFCLSMIFLSTQINWTGQILEEGPRLCLLLADRIGSEIGPIGRGVFLLGFWGAAFSSVLGVFHGVPFLFDDWFHLWRRETPTGQQGGAYRAWAGYLTLAAISALLIRRPVWLVFAYTVVGSHVYLDEGAFAVHVTITDDGATAIANGSARILEELLPDGSRGTPNQRFLTETYRDLFDRQVDSTALPFWGAQLDAGRSRHCSARNAAR